MDFNTYEELAAYHERSTELAAAARGADLRRYHVWLLERLDRVKALWGRWSWGQLAKKIATLASDIKYDTNIRIFSEAEFSIKEVGLTWGVGDF